MQNCSYDLGGGALITNRQRFLLTDSIKYLKNAIEQLDLGEGVDVVASTLHGFVHVIKEVVGEVPDKMILQNIFNNFCVGK